MDSIKMREALHKLYKWASHQKGWDATEWRDVRDALSKQEAGEVPAAWRDVLAERLRHQSVEGWTPEHDDQHGNGEMAQAAAAYALAGSMNDWARQNFLGEWHAGKHTEIRRLWPWGWEWWKPKDRRRDLVRAAALLIAEIERLDRAAKQEGLVAGGEQDKPSSVCTPLPAPDAGEKS